MANRCGKHKISTVPNSPRVFAFYTIASARAGPVGTCGYCTAATETLGSPRVRHIGLRGGRKVSSPVKPIASSCAYAHQPVGQAPPRTCSFHDHTFVSPLHRCPTRATLHSPGNGPRTVFVLKKNLKN